MKRDFRDHPLWLAFCVFCTVMGIASLLNGCAAYQRGGGEGDYLAEAAAVRWPAREVRYWIEPTSSSVGVDMPRAAERGLREWQEPLGERLTLTKTGDRAAAQIVVRFGTRDEMGSRQDVANLSYADPHHLVLGGAEVVIDRRLLPWDITAAARHGMGHALGWRGHPKDKRSCMYHEPRFWARISDKDERTIQAIYSSAM